MKGAAQVKSSPCPHTEGVSSGPLRSRRQNENQHEEIGEGWGGDSCEVKGEQEQESAGVSAEWDA